MERVGRASVLPVKAGTFTVYLKNVDRDGAGAEKAPEKAAGACDMVKEQLNGGYLI